MKRRNWKQERLIEVNAGDLKDVRDKHGIVDGWQIFDDDLPWPIFDKLPESTPNTTFHVRPFSVKRKLSEDHLAVMAFIRSTSGPAADMRIYGKIPTSALGHASVEAWMLATGYEMMWPDDLLRRVS